MKKYLTLEQVKFIARQQGINFEQASITQAHANEVNKQLNLQGEYAAAQIWNMTDNLDYYEAQTVHNVLSNPLPISHGEYIACMYLSGICGFLLGGLFVLLTQGGY